MSLESLRFGTWWKHERVRLESRDGKDWLVGLGTWEKQDVLSRDIHSDDTRQVIVKPYQEFASIETPEDALAFANKYGLLGLLPAEVDEDTSYRFLGENDTPPPGEEDAFCKLIKLPDPWGRLLSLDEAREKLMLSPVEFEQAIGRHRWMYFYGKPLFYPEQVQQWLNRASELRLVLEYFSGDRYKDRDQARRLFREANRPRHEAMRAGRYDVAERYEKALDKARYDLKVWTTLDSFRANAEITMNRGSLYLHYDSLLDALQLSAKMDLDTPKGLPPRRCHGPACGRWFSPHYPSTRYCSTQCQRSAQNRRNYQRRKQRMAT